jgi:hypothetical protein
MMIANDQEFDAPQDRISLFQRKQTAMRQTARAEEFETVTSGYRREIERMQAEVLEYLLRPLPGPPEKQSA